MNIDNVYQWHLEEANNLMQAANRSQTHPDAKLSECNMSYHLQRGDRLYKESLHHFDMAKAIFDFMAQQS